MSENLVKFTKESLGDAHSLWIKLAEQHDMPTIDIERLFDWSASRINYKGKSCESYAYAVLDDNTSECLAIVDIVHSTNNPQKTYIKMLTVDLSPKLMKALFKEDMNELEAIIDVYSKATYGTLMLTSEHKAMIVKLYGRDEPMRLLLSSLKERITLSPDIPIEAKWEGWWLTVHQA
jgi:hypothetical protein